MGLNNIIKRLQDIMRNDAGINGDAQRIEQMVWILFLKVYDAKEQIWEFYNENYKSIIPDELRWRNWAVDNKDGQALTGDALLEFVNNELFPKLKSIEIDETTPMSQLIVRKAFEDNNNYMKDGILLRQVVNVIDEINFEDYEDRHAFGEIYETILKSLQSAGNAGEFYTPRAVTDFMVQMIKPKLGEKVADFACGTGGFLTSALKELDKQVKTVEDREKYNNSVYGIEKKALPFLLCATNMLLHDIDNPQIIHGNSLEKNVRDYTEDDCFDVVIMNPPYGGNEKDGIKQNFPTELRGSETADLFLSVIMYRLKQNGRCAVILPDGFLFGTDNVKTAIKKKMLSEFNLHTVIRLPNSVFSPYTSITTNILFFDKTGGTKETWFYRLDMPEGYKNFSKTKPMRVEHFAPAMEWWKNRREITEDGFDKAKKYTAEEIAENNYNLDLCGYPHEEEKILPPRELILQYQEKMDDLYSNVNKIMLLYKDKMDLIKSENNGISDDTNIKNYKSIFDDIAMLNSTFPDKLKKSLLQEAVQGKLIPQNPSDEPASVLLEKIRVEKERLIEDGKIKKDKPLPPITDEEKPFDIPDSWEWVRLGEIGESNIGLTYKPSDVSPMGTPVLRSNNIRNGRMNYTNLLFVSCDIPAKSICQKGDILICARNGSRALVGKSAIVDKDGMAFGAFMAIYRSVCNPYIQVFINSPLFRNQLEGVKTTTINQITQAMIKNQILPLPPLAEQRRIVEYLDSLLPKLDDIKFL